MRSTCPHSPLQSPLPHDTHTPPESDTLRAMPRMCVLPVCLLAGACTHHAPTISHVVLISLEDSSQTPALQADCNRLLTQIPAVRTYTAGSHIDIGRDSVLHDYDLGLIVTFDDADAYRAYVDHPLHIQLVETWRDRFASIRVWDIHDPEGVR